MKHSALLPILLVSLLLSLTACVSEEKDTPQAGEADYTNPDELYNLVSLQDTPYILIDVRTSEEYQSGHIPTSVNIPYDVLAENLPTENTGEDIIVYCRSGRRSGIAAETLKDLDFSNVYDFGSINNWPGELESEQQ